MPQVRGSLRQGGVSVRMRRARVERTKLPDLVGVRALAVGAGHLEDDGQTLQLRIREEDAQPFADQALADVVVAIAIRSERCFGVVRVQCTQSVEPDAPVEVV